MLLIAAVGLGDLSGLSGLGVAPVRCLLEVFWLLLVCLLGFLLLLFILFLPSQPFLLSCLGAVQVECLLGVVLLFLLFLRFLLTIEVLLPTGVLSLQLHIAAAALVALGILGVAPIKSLLKFFLLSLVILLTRMEILLSARVLLLLVAAIALVAFGGVV
jgi:hypothetical protein